MSAALIALAAQIGAPILRDILSQKIGSANTALAEQVVGAIARRAGVTTDELPGLVETNQPVVIDAMREVERSSPELVALYALGVQKQFELLMSEKDDPTWMRAWRPLGMYGLGFLWFWNLVFLHVLNAIFKIALPMTDLVILFQVTIAYMGLYMGGHTAKEIAANFFTAWKQRT